ncbi:unnamed protein product [Paramecium sonneborni]|uniref:Uncharacterized protein n=1 Tax=Paramecium sonneborni TaxID=65129 RepID=A0A8S1RR02_9CILI|nr:unnamed protein product [Paramecium sonneborni]
MLTELLIFIRKNQFNVFLKIKEFQIFQLEFLTLNSQNKNQKKIVILMIFGCKSWKSGFINDHSKHLKVLKHHQTNDTSTFVYGIVSNSILQVKYYDKQSVYNYLSAKLVYSIPGNCNITNNLQNIYVSKMFLNELAIKNSSIIQLNVTLNQQQTKPSPTFVVDGLEFSSFENF